MRGTRDTRRDHPRACGENTTRITSRSVRGGSPPRVRGKRFLGVVHCVTLRITPARAGKTNSGSATAEYRRDHPRACGENYNDDPKSCGDEGSPPRVRGKLADLEIALWLAGITPARAGKTGQEKHREPADEDHPRACGENAATVYVSPGTMGSPPRVRGKPGETEPLRSLGRITPARAGKTGLQHVPARKGRDHPRACGENHVDQRPRPAGMGSPPRVRGKHDDPVELVAAAGITPARAGKTWIHRPLYERWRDHPRACGENKPTESPGALSEGSPPRVRGKRKLRPFPATRTRITPARAGKTLRP